MVVEWKLCRLVKSVLPKTLHTDMWCNEACFFLPLMLKIRIISIPIDSNYTERWWFIKATIMGKWNGKTSNKILIERLWRRGKRSHLHDFVHFNWNLYQNDHLGWGIFIMRYIFTLSSVTKSLFARRIILRQFVNKGKRFMQIFGV